MLRKHASPAPRSRIRREEVEQEIQRLVDSWQREIDQHDAYPNHHSCLSAETISSTDPFDKPQLEHTLLVCKQSANLSEAGRKLFAISRTKRKSTNDGDRLRKYLAKFDLSFEDLT